jgi:hypothetical protein
MKFDQKTFTKESIELDFNEFKDCTFKDCTLSYLGYGLFTLNGCRFENVAWRFGGAAANTIAFLTAMYHGAGEGGRALVERTLENIRTNQNGA